MRRYVIGIPLLAVMMLTGAVVYTGVTDHPAAVTMPTATAPVPPMVAVQTAYQHHVGYIPVLAWHQVIGGVARTPEQNVIWNFNRDCSPAAAVCKAKNSDETVSITQFDAEITALHNMGYQSVTAAQYTAWAEGRNPPLPARPILLTFDDGTANSYAGTTAVLERYGYNAVTFIVSQFAAGSSAGKQPFVTWDMTWAQLRALPANVWSFAFHAGAHGHVVAFPQNKACTFYYPCQLPGEGNVRYKTRVSGEITAGQSAESAELGTRMDAAMWAVPWNDIAQQPGLPVSGREPARWLAKWAGSRFQVVFIQDPGHNGYLHERYRLEVHGTWPLSEFMTQLRNNIRDGFFGKA